VAQYSNEHLTTTQISAYLDKELAGDELSLCSAHLQSCQSCQDLLTDFRLTSSLLRGMPQVNVPRSFVLPLNIAVLPRTPEEVTLPQPARRTGQGQHLLGRSLRVLSTLVAVLGLLFILSGAISSLAHGSVNSGSVSSTGVAYPSSAPNTPIQSSQQILPTSTPASIATVPGQINQMFSSTPPALLDPAQPLGRLVIGSLLFLLGILGVVLTRRFRRKKTYA
jgi:predicted anti-sigma-YlaC factor YlaD